MAGAPLNELAGSWSHDGRFFLYSVADPGTKTDLLYRECRKDGTCAEPSVFLKTSANEAAAQFSPDGHFVVYVSDESGRNEVYVRDFPKGARKWQISADGGIAPRWSRDGREIFFVDRTWMKTAAVTARPAFGGKAPVTLFENRHLRLITAGGISAYPEYDVSADGNRFLVLDRPAGEPPLAIHVVHNWFEEFRSK